MLASQSVGDLVELPVLQGLPEPVGEVEEHPLQQQDEGDPLVVRVVDLLVALLGLGQPRVGKVLALHSGFVCKTWSGVNTVIHYRVVQFDFTPEI